METNMEHKEEKDYAKLIAAQNESARRLKIKSINNTLKEEQKEKTNMAIVSGICFAGLIVATHFSGIDPNEALATEIKALSSYESLKDYLSMFTPAMYGTLIATARSASLYMKHKKNYDKANQEFYDIMNNEPEIYQDVVENQAKSK